MKHLFLLMSFLIIFTNSSSQELDLSSDLTQAVLEGGISYNILRYPTDVSFDYPEGSMTFNIPLDLTTNKIDFSSNLPGSNEKFTPKMGARQRLNFGLRINIPMLRGVFSYGQSDNVYFGFKMNMGGNVGIDTTIDLSEEEDSNMGNAFLALKGGINAPIIYEMGWRTQTFGYAFKPMKNMVIGINLHNHLFEATANGIVNTNILGNVAIDMPDMGLSKDIALNYSEEDVYGHVTGNYKGSAWSPAFGIKWRRLNFTARFGVNTTVKGYFRMNWQLPFFIDPNPKSFKVQEDELVVTDIMEGDSIDYNSLLTDFSALESRVNSAETDSFVLDTKTNAEFNIPSGFTITLEAIKNHLSFSYTYVNGAIYGFHRNEEGERDFDLGFDVNHIFLMNLSIWRANMVLGAFTMDFYEMDKENWLSDGMKENGFPVILGGIPLPVLTLSTSFGSAARIPVELDILPIPALKTGLIYYF